MAQLTHPENRSLVRDGDPYPTLAVNSRPHVAISFKPSHFTRAKDGAPSEVSHPLSADVDKGDQDPIVLQAPTGPFIVSLWQMNAISQDVSTTICAKPSGGWNLYSTPILCQPAPGFSPDAPAPAEGEPTIAIDAQNILTNDRVFPTIDTGAENWNRGPQVLRRGVVRRLTPVECCRLMAWPDTWLDVPLNEKGKMPSDTRKYRAVGNGVASNVAEWLARRIDTHFPR
jgi:hypothetical protein